MRALGPASPKTPKMVWVDAKGWDRYMKTEHSLEEGNVLERKVMVADSGYKRGLRAVQTTRG